MGHADREDDARRRLRRPIRRQSRRALGAPREHRVSAQRFLRNRRGSSLPIATAVQAANNDSILMAFPIRAFGKNEAPVIDVTRLYATEVPEFSARRPLRARGFDASRSYIDRIRAFPENIEVEAVQTYTNPPEAPAAGGRERRAGAGPRRKRRRDGHAGQQRHRGDALQHGETARK